MLNRIRHSGKKRRAKRFPAFMLAVLLLAGAPAGQLHAGMVWGQEDGGQEIAEQTQDVENRQEAGRALQLSAPSAVLMEASTGTVVYAQNADVPCSPASITKIMTLLLIFEALEKGDISLEDEVMTSGHAQSMGGSQVFLEEGEMQTVDTLIKCIAVASGNDAAVAMAEFIAGSACVYQ